ncbi:hypothetical protein KQ878_00865 [Mycoplasma zalophidermidis]|uniref:Uncharacterized protein n=1 Tax=Mycoplasma zalophidermidis TaxID=398174 RepID=A0ABS6DR34_9MOLU|nr:hypothetical protein [Mycoplasma zalophidermidis]MBU4693437.1 hypothetical protein [Mycoplasma zalophidermidis]
MININKNKNSERLLDFDNEQDCEAFFDFANDKYNYELLFTTNNYDEEYYASEYPNIYSFKWTYTDDGEKDEFIEKIDTNNCSAIELWWFINDFSEKVSDTPYSLLTIDEDGYVNLEMFQHFAYDEYRTRRKELQNQHLRWRQIETIAQYDDNYVKDFNINIDKLESIQEKIDYKLSVIEFNNLLENEDNEKLGYKLIDVAKTINDLDEINNFMWTMLNDKVENIDWIAEYLKNNEIWNLDPNNKPENLKEIVDEYIINMEHDRLKINLSKVLIEPLDYENISYMTQYAHEWDSDEDVVNQFNEIMGSLNSDEERRAYKTLIENINENMKNGNDDINKKIFDLISTNNNIDDLEKLNELMEINLNRPSALPGFDEYLEYNEIYIGHDLLEIVDEDVKEYGLDSKYIRLVEDILDINKNEYVELDAYLNSVKSVGKLRDVADKYLNEISNRELASLLELEQTKSLKL